MICACPLSADTISPGRTLTCVLRRGLPARSCRGVGMAMIRDKVRVRVRTRDRDRDSNRTGTGREVHRRGRSVFLHSVCRVDC